MKRTLKLVIIADKTECGQCGYCDVEDSKCTLLDLRLGLNADETDNLRDEACIAMEADSSWVPLVPATVTYVRDLEARLALADAVIEAARRITDEAPGTDEFYGACDGFDIALAAYDAAKEGTP